MSTTVESPSHAFIEREAAIVRFAGDSGDGMQLVGGQFTNASAVFGNDVSTFPDFPAEIRAPAGTLAGVSGFQIHFSSHDIKTPGDQLDALVAMNPAALKANLRDLKKGGILIVNTDSFAPSDLKKAGYGSSPLDDNSLDEYLLVRVPMTKLNRESVGQTSLSQRSIDRSKNLFALGLVYWIFDRPMEPTLNWIREKFAKVQDVLEGNTNSLKAGYFFGETLELITNRYRIAPATDIPPGKYRQIMGNQALAYGMVTAGKLAGKEVVYASYPITPASDILHELSKLKHYGVRTFQAEDEISAMGAAIGAAYGGALAATGTSGPGLALKAEAIGLAVMTELPVVIVDVQRGGPSTGLPTKTEQADLLQAMYGRNGECPVPLIAAAHPSDCFDVAIEAFRIATEFMTPVILLSDGYIANGAEPWRIPELSELKPLSIHHPGVNGNAASHFGSSGNGSNGSNSLNGSNGAGDHSAANSGSTPAGADAGVRAGSETGFKPYARNDRLARPWAVPGTRGYEHRIGGLEKEHITGNVSYDPENHEKMVKLRQAKVDGIARHIPPQTVVGPAAGELLVVSWGGTYGAVSTACAQARDQGLKVAHAHLRYLNPFPANLESILKSYRKVLVPELNLGQLLLLLRGRFLVNAKGYNKVKGLPFKIDELLQAIDTLYRE